MFSPAYAFTSLHYLKHQGIPRLPPFFSSFPVFFSLVYLPFIYSAEPHSSPLLASSLLAPIHSGLSSSFPSAVNSFFHLLSSFSSLFSFPPIVSTHLPSPLPFSSSPPAVTPPLTTLVHPLMIAEHISFDMKTKGWVHMWFPYKSCVIWNINAGIIWLPGWGVEVGGCGGFIITSDCHFLPQRMVRLSGWIEKQ